MDKRTGTANGKIVQIIGSVIDVEFPREGIPAVYEALKLVDQDLTLEVQQQLGDGIVRTIAMGASEGLKRGLGVKSTGAPITVPVGVGTLGRIMDVLGKPQDEGGPIKTQGFPADPPPGAGVRRADRRPGPARDRHQGHRPARAVREGRQDRPVRRRRRRQDRQHAGAHQQHREGAQRPFRVRRRRRAHPRGQRLLSRDDGVGRHRQEGPDEFQGRDGVRPDERAAGQSPARRPHRPHHGGVFPRREAGGGKGRDVLLFIDNIYRYTLAGTEVSALLGRMPSAVGYQPTLAEEMGVLQERITSTKTGSITSVQAIYVPADDLTDPSPATTFAHLDATIVLSRQIASLGIYPAVDPLDSTSRQLDPLVIGEEHYNTARGVQVILQRYKELQDIIAILGMDELSEEDKHHRAPRAQDPALPVAAVPRRGSVHRQPRQVRARSRTRSAASRPSSRASTTTCPSRPSTWSAASRKRWRRRRRSPDHGEHDPHRHRQRRRRGLHRRGHDGLRARVGRRDRHRAAARAAPDRA